MLVAFETATEFGSLALLDAGELLAQHELVRGQRQAGSLLPALDALLSDRGLCLEDISEIALSIGPGSFTGLRIGLSTALGLCFGTARKIIPVPTLAALSLHAPAGERIVPLLDARRGQVYTGLYAAGGTCLLRDRVCEPGPWLESLAGDGPVHLLGAGVQLHEAAIRKALGAEARLLEPDAGRPQAASVGRLGARLLREGGALPPREIELRYLRRAEAEEKRLAGHGFPEPIT